MSIEEMLGCIRKYNIDSVSVLPRGVSVPGFNLNQLHKRLNEARNAFIMLNDNHMYIDAALIAGHILEVCATIYYIKSAKNPEVNARKYIARSAVNTLFSILEIDTSDLENEIYKGLFDECVGYLEKVGSLILKKTEKDTDKDMHNKDVIVQLRSKTSTNKEKRDLLKNSYEMPVVSDVLNYFVAGMQRQLQENPIENSLILAQCIKLFYLTYCGYKHAGAAIYPEEISEEEIKAMEITSEIYVPAVFICLDTLSDSPVYIR